MIFSIIILLSFVAAVNSNVMGIDFGSDSMKVAIVQPGMPLEIVTNFQSKRKTPTYLTFYRGERMFGSDSYALMARKPELTFAKFSRMLGKTADHPLVKEISTQYFPYEMYTNETTGLMCLKQEETYYTPEELIAMMMQYAKLMTKNFGGKEIKDCVVTVPSSFTQQERRALFTAADIADLRVLSLIEENTAAALHYGIDRVFEQPNTVLYYNMGASSVQVSVVTYSSYSEKVGGTNKTIGQFEVVGKAWDSTLGGFNFDLKLAELLADRFNEAWNKKSKSTDKDVRAFTRPMTRLRLEANKMKEVLSANVEFPIKAEQLHADVDLNTKVTRAQFEEVAADLLARMTDPIDKALAMANLTLAQVNAVELLGGGIRVPSVKKILDNYFKESKLELGQHLNGDEAMALGAAFRAANLSTAFRVRKVGISDISTIAVAVRLETLPKEDSPRGLFGFFKSAKKPAEEATDVDAWQKNTTLYPIKTSVPAKMKSLKFDYNNDIVCKIHYDDTEVPLPEGVDSVLAVYNITGLADFAKEVEKKGIDTLPKVHLSFVMDTSGVVSLVRAEASVDLPQPAETKVESEIASDNETATSEASDEAVQDGDKAATEGEKETESAEDTKKDKKDSKKDKKGKKDAKKDKKKEEKKETVLRRVLTILENYDATTPTTWTPALKKAAQSNLVRLQEIDDRRKAKEAALNDLEGYIYSVKNKISDEEDNLKTVSTDEQRQEVVDLANAAEEWLYDEGRDVEVPVYKAKLAEIKIKAVAIFKRYTESSERPNAIKKAIKQLDSIEEQVAEWSEKLPQVTDDEKSKLVESVAAARKWIEEKESAQKAKTAFEDPAFESTDVPIQMKTTYAKFEKLLKKPKPLPPKVNITETNSTNTTEGNETIKVEVTPEVDANTTSSDSSSTEDDKKPAAGEDEL